MRKILKFSSLLLGLSLVGGGIAVGVEKGVGEVSAKNVESTLTFTKACGGSGTADDGVTWTVESDAAESNYDGTKGIHYGTGSAAVSYLKLTSAAFTDTVSKVEISCSDANKTAALTVKVGTTSFMCGESTSIVESNYNNTAYTFTGSATGAIVVELNRNSAKKGLYVKSIVVTYDDGETVINVDDVAISKANLTIGIGETSQLEATVSPDDASDKSVTWSSDNEGIATVDKNGLVEGVAIGKTVIRVLTNDGEYEDYCEVTVVDDGLIREKLTYENFTATSNSYSEFNGVSVSSKALYSGSTNKQGTAFAIKSSTFGLWTTQTGGLIKSISVQMGANSSASAKYVVYGTNTPIKDEEDLTALEDTIISSTNESKTVSLDKDYQFFAIKSSNNSPQISSVKIEWEPVKPLSISADNAMTLTIDQTKELKYSLINKELIVTETEVEFSSDSAAVTVSNEGVIKGISEGTANITIKSKADSTVTKTIAVTVSATKTPVESVTISETELVLEETDSYELSAEVLPNDASIKNVEWSSSDETVATVDQDGKVAALKAGNATIKVESTDNPKKYAECAVTVTERPKASYELVTEDSQLVVGAKYIVVGIKEGTYYAMGHYASGNNIKPAEIPTPENDVFSLAEETLDTYAYVLGGESGAYTFFDGAKYIYAAGGTNSKDNYLKATTTVNENAQFEVSVDGTSHEATILAISETTVNKLLRFNLVSSLFSCYLDNTKQSAVYLYKLVPQEGTAEAYATEFLNRTGAVCAESGDHETGLQGIWTDLAEMYNELGSNEQAKILAEEPSSLIKSMLDRYDYIVAKYSLENFITGHEVSPLNNSVYYVGKQNNDSAVTIIVIVSVASVTCLGVLVTLKKRKTINK